MFIGFEMVDETNFKKKTETGNEQNAQIVKVHSRRRRVSNVKITFTK